MTKGYLPKLKALPKQFTKGVLSKIDGRTELKRRLSHTYNRVLDDCGGVEALPHVKVCLVERFAWLEEFQRQIESKLAEGATDQAKLLGCWIQGTNAMSGLAKVLGLAAPKGDALDVLYSQPADEAPNAPATGPSNAVGTPNGAGKGKLPKAGNEAPESPRDEEPAQ